MKVEINEKGGHAVKPVSKCEDCRHKWESSRLVNAVGSAVNWSSIGTLDLSIIVRLYSYIAGPGLYTSLFLHLRVTK